MSYSKNKKSSRLSWLYQPLPVICGLVIILVVVLAGLELTNTTHIFHKTPLKKTAVIATTSSAKKTGSAKPNTVAKSSATTSAANTASGSSKSTAISGTGSGVLIDPSGTFVSSHKVSLGGQENSICNTTPGAACTITFTMGGITRSLGTQTTDSNGSTSWDWTVNDTSSGFSRGTWSIKATASLNGQTKTVSDSMPLEVGS